MKRLIAPKQKMSSIAVALALAGMAAVPAAGWAADKSNPNCPTETAFYDPSRGEDIVVPKGFKVEVFARDLNMPTDIAFVGNKDKFQVVVLESGTGLPSRCNDNRPLGTFSPDNPFTPDVIVFDQDGRKLSGRLGKPTATGGGFQADGPAIGLTFEREFQGGRLFATDSNQGVRGAQSGGGNNTSRVLEIKISKDLKSAQVVTLIQGLPTGDHPTEQIVAKDGFDNKVEKYTAQQRLMINAAESHRIPFSIVKLPHVDGRSPGRGVIAFQEKSKPPAQVSRKV